MRRWMQTRTVAWMLAATLVWGWLASAQVATQPLTPAEHRRGPEQTLLTYPEWFLVFSPAELAQFTAVQPPSRFPWYGHIGQFWQSYAAVTTETARRDLDPNPGYHLMILVIGVSTSVEYALRSGYEMLLGRLTEASASGPTAEDRYAARAAQEYVDFIRVLPWYEFDFAARLRALWTDTGFSGPDQLRKWERKFALSTEYALKMLYGKLIKLGTQSVYDAPLHVTAVLTRPAPAPDASLPELKTLQTLPDGRALVTVPRYEAFTVYAQALAAQGLDFEEIAGNRRMILVSLHAPRGWTPPAETPALFAQHILTQAGPQRVALKVPVARLAAQLRQWRIEGLRLEHVFDY
ncbi:MAG: hypothetical protein OEY75_05260 [Hylemonella sp.]|nr:hypothetical protein [Hylemonella sp.]